MFDSHVHAAPDIVDRIGADGDVLAAYETGGFAYQLFHQPGRSPGMLAEVARAAGDRLVLASDTGQPDSPSPPRALHQLIDALVDEGLDRHRMEAAASTVPTELFLR